MKIQDIRIYTNSYVHFDREFHDPGNEELKSAL